MAKLIDEFRRSWRGISQPALPFSIAFAVLCLALATVARWGLAVIRPADAGVKAVRVDAEDDDLGQAALVSRPQSQSIRLHGALAQ